MLVRLYLASLADVLHMLGHGLNALIWRDR